MFGDTTVGGEEVVVLVVRSCEDMCLDFIDVVQAYCRAKARRKVYVQLPREDHE